MLHNKYYIMLAVSGSGSDGDINLSYEFIPS